MYWKSNAMVISIFTYANRLFYSQIYYFYPKHLGYEIYMQMLQLF